MALSDTRNILLNALPAEDRCALLADAERVSVERGQLLVAAHTRIETVYFPEGGIASITLRPAEGERTEVGIFGFEGMSGVALLLGAERTPHDTFQQVDGADALRVEAKVFLDMVEERPSVRHTMLRFAQTMMVQVSSGVVANAHAQIEARLARWLLMCHDRVEGDVITLTHEFMGIMIGAQRSGVTLALHVLEGVGAIRSTRGKVTIRDREKLADLAGDNYGVAEVEYRRLIGAFGHETKVRPD